MSGRLTARSWIGCSRRSAPSELPNQALHLTRHASYALAQPQVNARDVGRTEMVTESGSFLISLSERLWPIANAGFSALSPCEQVFILVWELEAEVNNGGFNQFFFNSAGDRASGTSAALRTIGAERAASIVDRATSLFPDGPPADRCVRQDILDAIDPDVELFEELDLEFYKYPDNLSELLYKYVAEHRSDIRGT